MEQGRMREQEHFYEGELSAFGQEQTSPQKEPKKKGTAGERFVRVCYLPLSFLFCESIATLCVYRGFTEETVTALLYALFAGFLCNLFTLCFPAAVNRTIAYVCLTGVTVYMNVQMIYYTVFTRFFSFRLLFGVGTDVLEFKENIFQAVGMRWYGVFLLLVPLLLRILLDFAGIGFQKKKITPLLVSAGGAALCYLCFFGTVFFGGKGPYSAWDLYWKHWDLLLGPKRLGFFATLGKDMVEVVFPGDDEALKELLVDVTPVATAYPKVPVTPVPENKEEQGREDTMQTTPSPMPEPAYHALYDFAALAEAEENETIKTLHTYFAGLSPEQENEYTGMFEGYNFIMITAEAFSPWAVDKELTPTLYKLTHSGFVFENFYTSYWYTSTSDGEYVACTGLIPDGTNSMTRSAQNDMRFAFGNQFAKLGYKTLAYHNHSYQYYKRHLSHPNLGYLYKGIGNGLELPSNCWPRSDYEMMQATFPEYSGEEPFHVYYMTVSGHMSYTFLDNTMANRNKEVVADLPYSEPARAYLACNYELEKALTYLLDELEKAGVAERTVLALSADHYPYGLTKEQIDELAGDEVEESFELYRNHFILWCAGMEETVHVEKYCSSLDIAPTIANLFGLPYDSRLYAGTDILSEKEGLVILADGSFITDRVKYNVKTKEATPINGQTVSKEYIDALILEVRKKFTMSKGILENDYYSYLP